MSNIIQYQGFVRTYLQKKSPLNFYALNNEAVQWPDDAYYNDILKPMIDNGEIVEYEILAIKDIYRTAQIDYSFKMFRLANDDDKKKIIKKHK